MHLKQIPLNQIIVEDRFRKDLGDIEALASDIERKGIIQPIAVQELPVSECEDEDGPNVDYCLLAGGRRIAAIQLLVDEDRYNLRSNGEIAIPCRVYRENLSKEEQLGIELSENIHRKDLSWQEEVALIDKIHKIYTKIHGSKTNPGKADAAGWSQADTAKLLGVDPSAISRDLQIAEVVEKLPEIKKAKNKIEAGKMMRTVAKTITTSIHAKAYEEKLKITPIEKVREELCSHYILGDAIEGLKALPSCSFDLIELDPPYAIDLVENKQSGAEFYNDIKQKEYDPFIDEVINESARVLKPDGFMLVWFGPEPWFDVILTSMRGAGLKTRGMPNIWTKPSGQTMSPKLYLASAYEMFFYGNKGNARIFKQGRINTFNYPPTPIKTKRHPTERPIELMEEILLTYTKPGANVLSPFLGSGNTILAAANLGMTCIGWDNVKEFKESFTMAVSQGEPKHYHSYQL